MRIHARRYFPYDMRGLPLWGKRERVSARARAQAKEVCKCAAQYACAHKQRKKKKEYTKRKIWKWKIMRDWKRTDLRLFTITSHESLSCTEHALWKRGYWVRWCWSCCIKNSELPSCTVSCMYLHKTLWWNINIIMIYIIGAHHHARILSYERVEWWGFQFVQFIVNVAFCLSVRHRIDILFCLPCYAHVIVCCLMSFCPPAQPNHLLSFCRERGRDE